MAHGWKHIVARMPDGAFVEVLHKPISLAGGVAANRSAWFARANSG
jgi:hypothetical protein